MATCAVNQSQQTIIKLAIKGADTGIFITTDDLHKHPDFADLTRTALNLRLQKLVLHGFIERKLKYGQASDLIPTTKAYAIFRPSL